MTIVINGTTGISGVDGSAGTPAVQGTDTNTGVFYPAADTVGVSTGGSERVRVDSSGNVGIGTSSPGYKLDVQSSASSGAPLMANFQSAGGDPQMYISNGTVKTQLTADATNSASIVGSFSNHPLIIRTNNTERMRIDTSGNLLIGTGGGSLPNGTSVYGSAFDDNGGNTKRLRLASSVTTTIQLVSFYNPNGNVGNITTNASATAYATSSDYRLKNTIAPMTGALAKVQALKPVTYKWNADNSDGQGFIAHELAEVVPQCVIGEKDAVDAEGNPVYQGIDTSFLVATLTAAIQELKGLVDTQASTITALTARIEALGAK